MKYLSLFSGIGGFELGLEQAYESKQNQTMDRNNRQNNSVSGFEREKHRTRMDTPQANGKSVNDFVSSTYPTCIGYSEIDKYATKIYEHHYPTHKNLGDITTIDAAELPDFDLLVGGFPCQSFSIAGKRRGFEDTRGTLFFDIARILREKQPRLFVLENVKGLLSHDQGRTFFIIITALDELGYDIQWQVLNSKDFGVPQNRERVFIIGHLRRTSRPEVFPIGNNNKEDIVENTIPKIHTIFKETEKLSDALRVGEVGDIANTLKGLGGGMGAKTGLWHVGEMKVRRLTPTECARLQGFPDSWHKIDGISDSQAYKVYGNAVTVNVVQAIMERIFSPHQI